MPFLPKLFQINWRGGDTPKFVLWSHNHPDTYTRKRLQKRNSQINISHEYRWKTLNKILAKWILKNTFKNLYTIIKCVYYRDIRIGWYPKINWYDKPHWQKNKNHMIISVDVEKTFAKIHHPFMIKILIKV